MTTEDKVSTRESHRERIREGQRKARKQMEYSKRRREDYRIWHGKNKDVRGTISQTETLNSWEKKNLKG